MKKSQFFAHHVPPRKEDVKIYFNQKGMPDPEAEAFYNFYELKHWTSKNGNFYNNWKCIAHNWIVSVITANPLLFNRLA